MNVGYTRVSKQEQKVALARRLFADPNQSIPEICSTLEISRSTLYRYVRDVKRASRPSDPPT